MNPYLAAAGLWAVGFVLMLAAWALRRCGDIVRGVAYAVIAAAIYALPLLQPGVPIGLKAVLTLATSAFFAPKLLDASLDNETWRRLPLFEWVKFVLHPQVLVRRRHVLERPRPLGQNLATFARGVLEMAAGVALFAWADAQNLGRHSFWLDHGVKLVAAYLFAFDGAMVLATGLFRLVGSPLQDVSRDPILAATPAEFWRRYNRVGGQAIYENIFKPVGGLRHPVRAILIGFILNGVYHEYLAWVLTGRVIGTLLAFFAIHAVAVAATFRLRPRGTWRVVGIAATAGLLFLTTVLFFIPVNRVFEWYDAPPRGR